MDHSIILFLGRRKSGKSHMLRQLVREAGERTLVLVYDRVRQFTTAQEFDEAYRSLRAFRADLDEGHFAQDPDDDESPDVGVAIFSPVNITADELAAEALALGDCVLAIDELDLECPNEGTTVREEHLRLIVESGRHRMDPPYRGEVTLMGGARRSAALHRSITAGADRMYIFRTTEPNDLTYIGKYCGDRFAAAVSALPPCPTCHERKEGAGHVHKFLLWPDDAD